MNEIKEFLSNPIIRALLQNYSVPFLCVSFFLFFILTNKNFEYKKVKSFVFGTLGILFLILSDSVECVCSLFESVNDYDVRIRIIAAACSYTLRVAVLYQFTSMFVNITNIITKIAFAIPTVITAIVAFSALANPEIFHYYDDPILGGNIIDRGPLISTPFIASIIYFILYLVGSFSKAKKGYHKEILIVGFIIGIVTVATVLEVTGIFKGLLTGAAIISLVFYYIYFLIENYTMDHLTHAYVRFKLYEDIRRYKQFSIIVIDINGLKKINDTKGHLAGDACLQNVVMDVRKSIPFGSNIYRMGGDEFVILLKTTRIEEVMEISRIMKDRIEKSGYTIALGYSINDNNYEFDELLTQADNMLYQDKEFYRSTQAKATQ